MAYSTLFIYVLVSLSSIIFRTACGRNPKMLNDLRRFNVEGVVGRFVVNRDALEQVIQSRKQKDASCKYDVNLQLPISPPRPTYNIKHHGEMTLLYGTITDHDLAAEMSYDSKEKVATSYHFLDAEIPIVIRNEKHAILSLHMFTNNTKNVLNPYLTSTKAVTQVDSIEEADDGTVSIRLGDDVMVLQVQDTVNCSNNLEKNVGKDFDQLSGEFIRFTNYPLTFDWGCELLGRNVSFCELLEGFRCEIAKVGGDVCTVTSTTFSERSPTAIQIVNMTGKFQEMLPFLAEMVPSASFQAEYSKREHTTGITYPCLTF